MSMKGAVVFSIRNVTDPTQPVVATWTTIKGVWGNLESLIREYPSTEYKVVIQPIRDVNNNTLTTEDVVENEIDGWAEKQFVHDIELVEPLQFEINPYGNSGDKGIIRVMAWVDLKVDLPFIQNSYEIEGCPDAEDIAVFKASILLEKTDPALSAILYTKATKGVF